LRRHRSWLSVLYKRAVLYRMRVYRAVSASLPAFHQFERIEAAVRADPDSRRAQEYRRTGLPELFTSMEETFMTTTG
jgi:hypothetical protein